MQASDRYVLHNVSFIFRSSGQLDHPNLKEEGEKGTVKTCSQKSEFKM